MFCPSKYALRSLRTWRFAVSGWMPKSSRIQLCERLSVRAFPTFHSSLNSLYCICSVSKKLASVSLSNRMKLLGKPTRPTILKRFEEHHIIFLPCWTSRPYGFFWKTARKNVESNKSPAILSVWAMKIILQCSLLDSGTSPLVIWTLFLLIAACLVNVAKLYQTRTCTKIYCFMTHLGPTR